VKTAKRKTLKKQKTRAKPKSWRDAVRLHLSKVPTVDAVFVKEGNETVHVSSLVKEHRDKYYRGLYRQEQQVMDEFPEISFEFHTWAHQGRDPSKPGPWGTELVYLR
jgi:hypothetical protein